MLVNSRPLHQVSVKHRTKHKHWHGAICCEQRFTTDMNTYKPDKSLHWIMLLLVKRIPSAYKIFTPHDRALAKTLLPCSRSYKTDPSESSRDNEPHQSLVCHQYLQKIKSTDLNDKSYFGCTDTYIVANGFFKQGLPAAATSL